MRMYAWVKEISKHSFISFSYTSITNFRRRWYLGSPNQVGDAIIGVEDSF